MIWRKGRQRHASLIAVRHCAEGLGFSFVSLAEVRLDWLGASIIIPGLDPKTTKPKVPMHGSRAEFVHASKSQRHAGAQETLCGGGVVLANLSGKLQARYHESCLGVQMFFRSIVVMWTVGKWDIQLRTSAGLSHEPPLPWASDKDREKSWLHDSLTCPECHCR